MFSEGAARVVAASLIAELQGGEQPSAYAGAGSCYIELGEIASGAVDVRLPSWGVAPGSFANPLSLLPVRRETLVPVERPVGSECSEVFQSQTHLTPARFSQVPYVST